MHIAKDLPLAQVHRYIERLVRADSHHGKAGRYRISFFEIPPTSSVITNPTYREVGGDFELPAGTQVSCLGFLLHPTKLMSYYMIW